MKRNNPIRYAVIGLGYIAQAAVLPAFKRAQKNSVLTTLISGDRKKLRVLGKKYGIGNLFYYDQYDEFLKSGTADAVYIALPNTMHAEYAVKAAEAGLHVLCEKPMATSELDALAMMNSATRNKTKLMIAYRLHFEQANLEAIKLIRNGKIGVPRIFNSTFTRQVKKGDIRLNKKLGGGSLWDLGIYCINAARYLFQDEPRSALAFSTGKTDARFRQVDEMTAATLRFPKGELATLTSSFGAADTSHYEIIGTKGVLRVEPAYDYSIPLAYKLTADGKTQSRKLNRHDQFGAELIYFSDCIQSGKQPEPSGREGLIDIQIIRALYHSAQTGKTVELKLAQNEKNIRQNQKMALPPVREPEYVHTSPMSR